MSIFGLSFAQRQEAPHSQLSSTANSDLHVWPSDDRFSSVFDKAIMHREKVPKRRRMLWSGAGDLNFQIVIDGV